MRGMGVASTSGRTALAPSLERGPPAPKRASRRRRRSAPPALAVVATLTSPPSASTSPSPRRPAPSVTSPTTTATTSTATSTTTTTTTTSSSAAAASVVVVPPRPEVPLTGREVEEHAMKSAVAWMRRWERGDPTARPPAPRLSRDTNGEGGGALARAYAACGEITADYAKTFYLGTKLMTPAKARAIWAIYVWCRRTDELVDGPNAPRMTPAALDRWEERLEAAWRGKPYDVLDAALSDTVAAFPVDIQPFRDMIDGMRMDLTKARYATYEELYEYCYRVAGAVGLMTTPVMGVAPAAAADPEPTLRAALALGTANQLTNILRDVGEDAQQRNRVYVPLEDLDRFGIAEAEVVSGSLVKILPNGRSDVDPRWKRFMAFQIERARACFADAEAGIGSLDADARWPVWSALILYRQILDSIEANDYDNFTKRAYVAKWRKYASLPAALMRARQGL